MSEEFDLDAALDEFAGGNKESPLSYTKPKQQRQRNLSEQALETVAHPGNKLVKGLTNILDYPEMALNAADWLASKQWGMQPQPKNWNLGQKTRNMLKENKIMYADEPYMPVDLKEQGIPPWITKPTIDVPVRTAGKAAQTIGENALIEPKLMAGLGAASNLLHEAGTPEIAADIIPFLFHAGYTSTNAIMNKLAQDKAKLRLIENLGGEKYVAQTIANIEKNMAQEFVPGYKPTTAEVADNAQLAKKERGIGAQTDAEKMASQKHENVIALHNAKTSLAPEGAEMGKAKEAIETHMLSEAERIEKGKATAQEYLTKAVNEELPFTHKSTEEAGRNIRDQIKGKTTRLEAERAAATQNSYADLGNNIEDRTAPTNFQEWLKKRFQYGKGTDKQMKSKLAAEVAPNKKEFISESNELGQMMNEIGSEYPEVAEALEALASKANLTQLPPTWSELFNTRKAINEAWRKEKIHVDTYGGSKKNLNSLNEARTKIDMDLQGGNPEAYGQMVETNKIYADKSKPLDAIKNDPQYKKIMKHVKLNKNQYIINNAEVPSLIYEGKFNRETAQRFRERFPGAVDDPHLQQSIHEEIRRRIVDPENGKVDTKKLEIFKRDNPGVLDLYPKLETNLKNVSNANAWTSKTLGEYDKYAETLGKSIASDILNENLSGVVRRISNSKNPTNEIMNIKKIINDGDPSGKGWKAIQKLYVDELDKRIGTLGHGEKGLSLKPFNDFMEENAKILPEVFTPEQMHIAQGLQNGMKARNKALTLGAVPGSPTHVNEAMAAKDSGLINIAATKLPWPAKIAALGAHAKTAGLGLMVNKLAQMHVTRTDKMFMRAMMDPDFAKMLLTPVGNKEKVIKAIKDFSKASARRRTAGLMYYEDTKENESPDLFQEAG